jgi:phage terminase large subunit-like protein
MTAGDGPALELRESRGGVACRWSERMLVHGEGDLYGRPYRLLPWQREFLWRWFEVDPALAGVAPWFYLEALIGAERGAVKTELLAALAHLEMTGPDGLRRPSTPIVHMAAASYEQAGELFRQAQIMGGGATGEELHSAPLFGLYDVFDGEIQFADGRPGRIQRVAAVAGTNEGGKGLALDTPIATPTGWTTMGELRRGDVIFAGDGSRTRVLWASGVHHRPCYRVAFSHGDDLVADDEHRWLVEPIRHRGPMRVTTTAALAADHLTGRGQTKWKVPVHGPLDTEPMDWPCDPWYVGYWLGDGTSTAGAITTADDEVLDRFRANAHGWDINHISRYTWGISAQHDRRRSFKVMLRNLGILPVKQVTQAMLRSSVPQRMALLQGWVDADGHVEQRGKVELSCTYPRLMAGAVELVTSLGLKSTLTGTSLWLWTDHPVAWLPRKAANLKAGSAVRRRSEAIRSVTPTATVPTRCIAVDHPSETFLAGRGMHVTHNSSLVLADELAEWTGRRDRLFTVLSASTTKRVPNPGRVVGISMAGVAKGTVPPRDHDPLLWRLYARGLLEAGDPTSRFLLDWVSAPEDLDLDDPEQCRAALRHMRGADVTWSVDVRAREILSRKMPRAEARRLYLCQWLDQAADSWLLELPGAWADADAGAAAIPDDRTDVVVGVDMALKADHVGVVVAGRLADGRVGWWARSWEPIDGRIDHADVFGTIAGTIAQRWRVKAVTYDPRFFELPANLLAAQGINVVEFPQSPERLIPADGLLYELLRTGELAHPGDPRLDAHAAAAAWRETERGRYLAKSRSGGHMDLIRAGSMATHELLIGSGEPTHAAATAAAVTGAAGPDDFFRPTRRLEL